ncbi:hypothetical protein GCM10011410_08970 [Hoyosella rhizosphaerae]|uniref:NlpC/P60 domain-containing protein n=1 Tax=Hoyosella rhizosphaerae TaxID=1755582 RepID=A0A916XA34_9ACTN|nr:hypothetical protein GCM10011410_08970 [Hoyosella rhizosphaerae]
MGAPIGGNSGTPVADPAPKPVPPGTVAPDPSPARVDIVVNRALSQVGVPYAWGGGNIHGPTRGIRDGGVADRHGDYNKIGFDCSGLVMFAFAGAGVMLPRTTSSIYTSGTRVPLAQRKRGDLLFWGPNGSHHVAIYLGDGRVVEAPHSGALVRIAPINWHGIQPSAVRLL